MAIGHDVGTLQSESGLFSSAHLRNSRRACNSTPGRNTACQTRAVRLERWLTFLLMLVLAVLPMAAHAQPATGGIGAYRDNIVWFSWGTNGAIAPVQTRTNSIPVGGLFLRTTCSLSAISGGFLTVFTPGAGGGNQLDTLYNIGGVNAANTMAIGLANGNTTNGQPVSFTLNCSATFGPTNTAADPPLALDGLIMADAEGSTATELIQVQMANAATARIIETYSPAGCPVGATGRATLVAAGPDQQLRVSGHNAVCTGNQRPTSISFIDGVTTGTFTLRGDGRSAIAVGVFVNVSDQGDAPASYGDAHHLTQFSWTGGTLPLSPNHNPPNGTSINTPAFTPAVQSSASTTRLGASVDVELTDLSNAAADGDDIDDIDDEDGIATAGPIVLPSTGAYTLSALPCTGTGRAVRGFIDWNIDGDFNDAEEASLPATCPAGGSVNVAWNAPTVVLQASSYMRLRIGGNAVEVANSTGIAGVGEVEDYPVTLVPTRLTLVKQLDGRVTAADQITVSIQNPTPVSVTTTGSGVEGTSTVSTPITDVTPDAPLVLRDALTAGTGAIGTYTKIIACVANPGSSGAVPVPTGPVIAGAQADWTLTPNVGNDLTCTITNTAPDPTFTIAKALTSESGSQAGVAEPGEQLTYTITATNTSAVDAAGVLIADAIPVNTTFVSASAGGGVVGGNVQWTQDIPANSSVALTVVFQVAGVIPTGITQIANNATVDNPSDTTPSTPCATSPCVTTPTSANVSTLKSSDVGDGTAVNVGDTITYTVTATVTGGVPLAQSLTLTDTLGSGLTLGSVTSPGAFTCNAVNPLLCTLPAGTTAGTYAVSYTATVDAAAVTSVSNTVEPSTGTCADCSTINPLVGVPSTTKTSDVGDGTAVQAGDVITYTLTTRVTGGPLTAQVTLTDILGSGLSFGTVTNLGAYAADTSGAPTLVFTLPVGTPVGAYAVSYTATVNTTATTSVSNTVTAVPGICTNNCSTRNPLVGTSTVKNSDVGDGTSVQTGDVITYTLTATVTGGALTQPLTLTDTLGSGLSLGSVTSSGAFACNAVNPLVCTLPAGTPAGLYLVSYTATVNATATTSVSNAVVPSAGTCATCSTTNPLAGLSTVKRSDVGDGTAVQPGDAITYTLTTTVTGGTLTQPLTLTDTLGSGLTFGSVTTGAFLCNSANPLVCTLPASTPVGTYEVSYTTTVDATATTTVSNAVVPSAGGCTTCSTTNPVVGISTVKNSNVGNGTAVQPGDVLTYTLTATVAGGALTQPLTLTDTLGSGLTFGSVTSAGAFAPNTAGAPTLVFTLPVGTPAGTYAVSYTATVDMAATTSVSNAVVASAGACISCSTTNPVAPGVTYGKAADTTGPVIVGDVITYTLSVTVANAQTADAVTLTDTLGTGLDFVDVTSAGVFACNAGNPLVCTLPGGTAPGTYTLSYQARVNPSASGAVNNTVIGTGADTPACAGACSTSTPVAAPIVTVAKSSDPAADTQVEFGQTITYTLTVTVSNAATQVDLTLVDTADPGLTIGTLPSGCAMSEATIRCTLPAGSPVGVYTFAYTGTVNAQAGGSISNEVTASVSAGDPPICASCSLTHQVTAPQVRLTKTVAVREVRIGDLVRYTLTVENVGDTNLVNGNIVDMPPAGFSYVEGSLQAVDDDNLINVEGHNPLRFKVVDVAVGQTATLTYLMRVGAGVRPGVHQNQAQTYAPNGTPISNVATAEVQLVADPLLDDSLIFGTVFDDRDGDGWQDNAGLRDVRVQGGFAPGAYIANSTTVDRGTGPQPEPDASSPMLHGIAVGAISARQSDADPVDNHRVVIRQRLSALAFTDDFVLTSAEGVAVRMDASGEATVEKSGEAAKGLNAAAPTVERRVAQGEGGYVVDYVIHNAGVDERGIPGVRIVSVEGLLIETDQYGRYHLAGIPGGSQERGRNFILKVDPSTLPSGATFTTDNPLLRRITPGLPVRFDWGTKLPVGLIKGGTEQVEMVLGTVCFAPGSAEVKAQYLPVIEKMAAKVREYHGGEVVIDANGDTEGLAFDRAMAVKQALLAALDAESAKGLVISARGKVDDPSSLVVGVDEGGALFGTVLFDTDKSAIRPEFEPLLDKVAAALDRMGGGSIAIVGHTDVRASYEYNAALGMRRAKAVYEALAKRLSLEVRAKVRVEANNDPTTPVDTERKQEGQGS
jgi:large repetitive protein